MKVATSAAAQQQSKKINKRPQLALDVAFKTGSSGIEVMSNVPAMEQNRKAAATSKFTMKAGWQRTLACLTAAALSFDPLSLI